MNELELPDVAALVRFGKLGMAVLASRMLSTVALGGVIALAGYATYLESWPGVCVTGIMLLALVVTIKAETGGEQVEKVQ